MLASALQKKGCLDKKYYGSEPVAAKAALLLSIAKSFNVTPYKCRYCCGFHLTKRKAV